MLVLNQYIFVYFPIFFLDVLRRACCPRLEPKCLEPNRQRVISSEFVEAPKMQVNPKPRLILSAEPCCLKDCCLISTLFLGYPKGAYKRPIENPRTSGKWCKQLLRSAGRFIS